MLLGESFIWQDGFYYYPQTTQTWQAILSSLHFNYAVQKPLDQSNCRFNF